MEWFEECLFIIRAPESISATFFGSIVTFSSFLLSLSPTDYFFPIVWPPKIENLFWGNSLFWKLETTFMPERKSNLSLVENFN